MKSLIAYIEGLSMVGGDRDGEPFVLLPWERRFIKGAFSADGDSALSVARGNGKSALLSGVACAVVDPDGPLHGPRREVVVVAAAFAQTRVIYEDCLAMLRSKHDGKLDPKIWRLQDSQNVATLEHRESGARIRCIGGDPKTAHGLRPSLALLDEPAQWEPARTDKMLAAIRTGLGKVPGSRLVALGTRPAGEHWFATMLQDASYSQTHAAGRDDDPFSMASIRKANPSLPHLPSLRKRLVLEREAAKRDPAMLASWRALRLNQGVGDVVESTLLDADTWGEIESVTASPDGSFILGVDLGGSAAMSAVSGYWPSTGLSDSFACFPEQPGLAERGLRDGCGDTYLRCAERSELIIAGDRVSDVGALLTEVLERWGRPAAVVCDRWREAELRQSLDRIAFPQAALVIRGQGFKDGADDVRRFRSACLDGHVHPRPSLLTRSAMAEARVVYDAAGNGKLAKSTQGGRRLNARDDVVAAMILAVSEGTRHPARPSSGSLRLTIVQ